MAEEAGLAFDDFLEDARLKEKGYGRWEGLTRPEIVRRGEQSELTAMDADPWGHKPPEGGESLDEVMARAGQWLRALNPSRPVIAVAHGGTGRTLIRAALGLGAGETLAIQMRQDVVFRIARGNLDILQTAPDFTG